VTTTFQDLVDLASERLGAAVVDANDEFFAPKENLIKPGPAEWREGVYTERGKWMDGWETRRRRDGGDHDWCLIRLGAPGIIRGVDVETTHFKGNYPESCAIDACDVKGLPTAETLAAAAWREILPRTPLAGDAHNLFRVDGAPRATHLRLRIFPDGGVARWRVYGEVVPDWRRLVLRGDVDLAAVEHGGLVVACSDMFFGSRHNLIMPGDATHMGDGWETRRRRGPGHDWTIVRLGAAGTIRRVEIDTRHFKGNAPGACSLEALRLTEDAGLAQVERLKQDEWQELLPRISLQPHARHTFEEELRPIGAVSHVRLNIFPDGGVGRLRLFGRPEDVRSAALSGPRLTRS
jgi:allantoicase